MLSPNSDWLSPDLWHLPVVVKCNSKQMNFFKSENIGKGFAILAQLIVLSQIAGTVVLKKALSKTK